MLVLAKAIRPICDTGDGWDAEPWLLAAANGVIDLRTGELREGRPVDRITMTARVAYDPAAKSRLWEQTVRDILGDDPDLISYMHRALGYSLTGDCREECLFLCWGDGRNGKGTLLNTVASTSRSLWRDRFSTRRTTHNGEAVTCLPFFGPAEA